MTRSITRCYQVRSGCAFMIHICEDEHQLFFHFFTSSTPLLKLVKHHNSILVTHVIISVFFWLFLCFFALAVTVLEALCFYVGRIFICNVVFAVYMPCIVRFSPNFVLHLGQKTN